MATEVSRPDNRHPAKRPLLRVVPQANIAPPGGEEVILHLTDFEVMEGPIHDPRIERLRPKDRERFNRASELVWKDPENHIPLYEGLVYEFPHIPQLWNYLLIAHDRARHYDKVNKVAFETLRRFPDYLFAVVACANIYLHEGNPEEVWRLLGGRFDLRALYPKRRRFHITEVVALYSMLVKYFRMIGEKRIARSYYALLCDLAPDHPATRQVGSLLRFRPLRGPLLWILRSLRATLSTRARPD